MLPSQQTTTSSLLSEEEEDLPRLPLQKCNISNEQRKACKNVPSDWIADTSATLNMTDKINLFRGGLKRIASCPIQVRGGVLYSCQRGTVEVIYRDGSSVLFINTLLILDLGVNLISGKRLYKSGLTRAFNA